MRARGARKSTGKDKSGVRLQARSRLRLRDERQRRDGRRETAAKGGFADSDNHGGDGGREVEQRGTTTAGERQWAAETVSR